MMKHRILGFAFSALVACTFVQPTEAGPIQVVANKTANVAHKAAYRIDRHVVRPTRRVIARNTPR